MAILPIKLLVLTVKTVAKPLASAFEARVMAIPVYRTFFIKVAQALHRLDVIITRGAEGRTGKVFVANVSDEEATKLASKVFSEGFLYMVASAMLMYELRVSSLDAAKKAEQQERREQALDARLAAIEESLRRTVGMEEGQRAVAARLEELGAKVRDLEGQKKRRSWLGFSAGGA